MSLAVSWESSQGNRLTRAFASIFTTEWQDIAAVAAPIRSNVGDRNEAMGDPVVDLDFVAVLQKFEWISTALSGMRLEDHHLPPLHCSC